MTLPALTPQNDTASKFSVRPPGDTRIIKGNLLNSLIIKICMKRQLFFAFFALAALTPFFAGAGPAPQYNACDAPQLPITGTRIVNVSTESQLQSAVGSLQDGDTIVLANGTYTLSSTLYVSNKQNVTIRGTSGCDGVALVGRGMDNAAFGPVYYGISTNSTNTIIAHMTIRDVYNSLIYVDGAAQSPAIYNVKLLNAGEFFVQVAPRVWAAGIGVDNGLVLYSRFEFPSGPPTVNHGIGTGYAYGISASTVENWVFRGNLFKNLRSPDSAGYPFNPGILLNSNTANNVVEQNVFYNTDHAVIAGFSNQSSIFDNTGGEIRNNFVYYDSGMITPSRKSMTDGAILSTDSSGTKIYHNTIITNGNITNSIRFTVADTTGGEIRNNLTDTAIDIRDGASVTQSGNVTTASTGLFAQPSSIDLHLLPSASIALNQVSAPGSVTTDFDGDNRPSGGASEVGADEYPTDASRPFAPVIFGQVLSQDILTAQSASFRIAGAGTPTLTYQWQRRPSGGSFADIPGATATTYALSSAQLSDSGSEFRCVVSNSSGSVTSNAATLTVQAPIAPIIVLQPQNLSVLAGGNATISFSFRATPPTTFTWQWAPAGSSSFNTMFSSSISAAESPLAYTASGLTLGDSGKQYRCVLTNASGTVTTNAATVTVTASAVPLVFVQQPANQSVSPGQDAAFSVTAGGTGPIYYQWQVSTDGGSTFSDVSGGVYYLYSLSSVSASLNGSRYRVRLTNSSGSITSASALLTVSSTDTVPPGAPTDFELVP